MLSRCTFQLLAHRAQIRRCRRARGERTPPLTFSRRRARDSRRSQLSYPGRRGRLPAAMTVASRPPTNAGFQDPDTRWGRKSPHWSKFEKWMAASVGNRAPPHGARLARRCPDERVSRHAFRLRVSEQGRGSRAPASASGASNGMERAEAYCCERRRRRRIRCSRRRSHNKGASAASTSPSGELCAGGDDGTTLFRSVSSDEDGGNPANIAASGASNQRQRDARAAQKHRLRARRPGLTRSTRIGRSATQDGAGR
jgi:hypothetical protein